MKRGALSLLIAFASLQAHSQATNPFCGSDILLRQQDNQTQQQHQQIEQNIYRDFNEGVAHRRGGGGGALYVIPVVIHIIHDNGPENISDAQVLQGITYINQAFANVGYYDSLSGVNTQIQFCLAKQDPQGAASDGIMRVQSALTNLDMSQDVQMKNLSRFNPRCYANIWLVKEICNSNGCSVAGYAYLPSSHGTNRDGVVMEASYFGSTPGKTNVATHELGHYFGLYHTFQGGCTNNNCLSDGDRVCDTPPDQSTAAIACNGSANTCSTDAQSGLPSDVPDLHRDYMDYGSISCFNLFTEGQRDRMWWHIDNVRSSLLNCLSCNDPCTSNITALFSSSANNTTVGSTVTFSDQSTGAATYTWYLNGQVFSAAASPNYTFNTKGTFIIRLKTVGTDLNCIDYFNDTITVICGAQASFTQPTTQVGTGQSINFTNTSTGATSYQWYFDGVLQTTTTNFNYTFNQQGTFAVYLIASNGICSDTTSVTHFINVGPPCNVSFTYSRSNPNTYLVLQPDAAAGKDAFMSTSNPNTNNATHPEVTTARWTCGGPPCSVKSVLEFDLSSIRSGSIIISASLSLYANLTASNGYPGTPTWGNNNASYLSRCTSSWDESTVTWNTPPTITTANRVLLPQSTTTTQDYLNMDITPFAQFWYQNPSQNYGMLLDMITNSNYNSLIFCSSDYPDSTRRPKLVVYYTPPSESCSPIYFIPDTTCRYSNYHWTFCQPSFDIPAVQNYPVTGPSPAGAKLLKDQNGNYFVFYCAYNPSGPMQYTVYRMDFGNSVNNTPTLHPINTSISEAYAHGIDVVYDGGNYYGFVIYNALIYRLDFGPDVTNDTPVVTQVTGYNTANTAWAHKIEIVHESNTWWLLVAARNGSNLSNLYLGNIITNNVQSANYNACPSCWGFSYQKVNGNHYVFATAVQSGMRLFSFGNSLANTPVVGAWATYGTGLHGDVSLYQNCDGSFDGVILKENQATHTIIHLDSITATPTVVVNSFSNGLNRSGSASRIMRTDAGLTMFAADSYGTGMARLNFPDCGITFSTAEFPPPVYFPQAGTYYVRLAVDEGLPTQQVYCDSITVNNTPRMIDLGNDTTVCLNQSFTLHAGAGYNSYLWNDNTTDSINTVSAAGTYWVEATDTCGNIARDTIIISVDSATAITLADTVICVGSNATLSAPVGFTVYQWTPSNSLSCANCRTTVATPPDTTAYTVTAFTVNGCVSVASAIVNVATCGSPLTISTTHTNVNCRGDSIGTASVFINGGTPQYHILWSTGDTTTIVIGLVAGTYTVTITDANNNTTTDTVVITQPSSVIGANTSLTPITCEGDSNGGIKLNISGGTPAYHILWNTSDSTASLSELAAGVYSATITDANGCVKISTTTLMPESVYSIDVAAINATCITATNGTAQVAINSPTTSPYAYSWSTGETSALINVSPGVYSVTVTDSLDCQKNASVEVGISGLFINAAVTDVSCPETPDGSIITTISGGTQPYVYVWNNGASTSSLTNIYYGMYSLTVTDHNDCSDSDTMIVEVDSSGIDDCDTLVIYEVFSPNGDGINDTWVIDGLESFPGNDMQIFNRWGSVVFEASPYMNDWNGNSKKGEPLPSATYYYILKLNNAQEKVYSGSVVLVR